MSRLKNSAGPTSDAASNANASIGSVALPYGRRSRIRGAPSAIDEATSLRRSDCQCANGPPSPVASAHSAPASSGAPASRAIRPSAAVK